MAHEFCPFNPWMFLFGLHRVFVDFFFFLMYLICMLLDKTQPLWVPVPAAHAAAPSVLVPVPALEHLNALTPGLGSPPAFQNCGPFRGSAGPCSQSLG